MDNLKKVTVSAPGKIMLMGEHSAVYGYPCIVTTVDFRLKINLEKLDQPDFIMNVPQLNLNGYSKNWDKMGNGDIPKSALFVETGIKKFFDKYLKNKKYYQKNPFGLKISANSSFSNHYGFGSSSASTVCAVKAMSLLFNINLASVDIFKLAYETVLDIQGQASGFDVAAATYGGTLFYQSYGAVIEPVEIKKIPMIVVYSGTKADTTKLIKEVADKKSNNSEKVDRIFKGISDLVFQGKKAIAEEDWVRLGTLYNFNQDYLRDLGVSTQRIEDIITAAKGVGAYGAKISGAGGGDCVIIIVKDQQKKEVIDSIQKIGGFVVDTAFNTYGVRVENDFNLNNSDDQNEMFVVVDKNDKIIGYRTRFDCHHDKSLIHRAVGVVVFNKKGEVLLQKRSLTKDSFPGFWTISSSGHVGVGEDYETAAKRELREELGIDTQLALGHKFYFEDEIESEINMIYRVSYDGPLKPDAKEVSEVAYFSKADLIDKIKKKHVQISDGGLQGLKVIGFL